MIYFINYANKILYNNKKFEETQMLNFLSIRIPTVEMKKYLNVNNNYLYSNI